MAQNKGERRLVLEGSGQIDPASLASYRDRGGYQALQQAVLERNPKEVLDEVERAGLRGRGGAGFPAAAKWRRVAESDAETKFVVANAYDADPSSPIGRTLLGQNPHRVIEGLLLAAYAVGAGQAFIYLAADSPKIYERVAKALGQAREAGLLGDRIAGSRFSCEVFLSRAWGGFVAGEETAVLAAIQGARATPEQKPPYPTEWGLFGKPTVVNSAETLASVPWIISQGADAFATLGTERSHGTKVVALNVEGQPSRVLEVELGTPLRALIELATAKQWNGHSPKAVQVGGPTGGFLPESLWDTPLDYETLTEAGCLMGSGSLVVLPHETCLVGRAAATLTYLSGEACGKCVPCRLGTKRMAGLLEGIVSGLGRDEDLELLEELSTTVSDGSLCGFGIGAPNPFRTSLRYFPQDYRTHLEDGRCPTGQCQPMRARRYERREVL